MYKSPRRENDDSDNMLEDDEPSGKNRASSRRQPPTRYSADAPIARRASLVRERQEQQRQAQGQARQQRQEKRQAQPARRQAPPPPTQPARTTSALQSRPARPATASPKRLSDAASRPRQTRRSQPQPFFTRRRIVTGAGIACLLLLLLVPLLLHANHPGASTDKIVTSDGTHVTGIGAQPTPTRTLVVKPTDLDHPPPPVLAASAYLLDADTGNTLYAANPFEHLPMLGATKLMTAILAIEEQGSNLDQPITITAAINNDISRLGPGSTLFGIKQGEIYSLRDLLYGQLFVSGDDAAIAIADALGGTLSHFVNEMNAKAQQLGMLDTHFANPHGLLQTGQYSCAHDLALLGRFAMTIPMLHAISGEKAYYIAAGGNHPQRYLLNENQFLWWYPGADGGQTGYDGQSDYIQVMSVTRNHHHLIGVVMHTTNWWKDMRDLMNWGFDTFTWVSPRLVDEQHPIPFDSLWNYFASDTIDMTVPTADKGRYYVYTGYSIDGAIMRYFDGHGGLQAFGYPTGLVTSPASSATQVSQRFQNATIQCNLTTQVCQKV